MMAQTHNENPWDEQNCPLLNLPPEVRNTIWELVLLSSGERTSSGAIVIDFCVKPIPPKKFRLAEIKSKSVKQFKPRITERSSQPPSVLNLLQVCRTIHTEAAGFYYRRIQLHYYDCRTSRSRFWSIGQLRLNGITHLTIALGPLSHRLETGCLDTAFNALPELPNLISLTFTIPDTVIIGRSSFCPWHKLDYRMIAPVELDSREMWRTKHNGVDIRLRFEELEPGSPLMQCRVQRLNWILEAVGKFDWAQPGNA